MSFSSAAKAELCRDKPERKCCALAESYGVLLYCNSFSAREIRIITASNKLRYYSKARFFSEEELIDIITGGWNEEWR